MSNKATIKNILYKLRKKGRVVVYNPKGIKYYMEFKKGSMYTKYTSFTSTEPLADVNLPAAILSGMYLLENIYIQREKTRAAKYSNYRPVHPELLTK